jgi:tetratricopeptide (TPR) repeat protein
VLMQAAQEQILEAAAVGWLPDAEQDLDAIVERHQIRIGRALRWLDAAVVESSRRGEPAPLQAWYWRAYAFAAMGDFPHAGEDLERAAEVGDVERWRIERMGSVVSLLEGDLQQALRSAHLSTVDAPHEDKVRSRYVLALVLDRAGASASAREEFRRIRHEPMHAGARQAVESFLPIHERLYLRALEHQANGERTNAVRLWDLYLARPEPDEPDRELARRHKAELSLVNPARVE